VILCYICCCFNSGGNVLGYVTNVELNKIVKELTQLFGESVGKYCGFGCWTVHLKFVVNINIKKVVLG